MSINKALKRIIPFLLCIISTLSPFLSYAHNSYFFQVLIDENNKTYSGSVIKDDARSWNRESKHIENQLGDFTDLFKNPYFSNSTNESDYDNGKVKPDAGGVSKKYMLFSFPSKEVKYGLLQNKSNDATSADIDRAYLINSILTPGLNDALKILNDGKNFTSTDNLIATAAKLTSFGTGSKVITTPAGKQYKVTYGANASYHKTTESDKKNYIKNNDYVLIKNVNNPTEEYQFTFRILKGYLPGGPLYDSKFDLSGDTEYITWHQMIYQGNYSYYIKNWTTMDANQLLNPGPLEEAIVDLAENTFNDLRNLLGLYSMNDLILNQGIRGSQGWWHGVMSNAWAENTVIYYYICMAAALALIGLAITKILIQRNIATINTSVRINLIESIQDLLITGFLLINIYPFINMIMILNAKIVNVIGATIPTLTELSSLNSYSSALGGVLMQFFYLIVTGYLNVSYIMRGMILALLISTAPLFVVSIAFGPKYKTLFTNWSREVISLIFVQTIQALILSFFLTTVSGSRGIETAVIAAALIPLTELFKQLVAPSDGNILTNSMGMTAIATGVSTVASLGKSSKQHGKSKEAQGSTGVSNGNQGYSREQSTNDSSNVFMRKSDSFSASDKRSMDMESKAAHESMAVPSDKIKDGRITNTDYDDSIGKSYSNVENGKLEAFQEKFEAFQNNGGKAVKTGAKIIGGAAKIGAGAGLKMAFGGVNPGMASMGVNTMVDGAKNMKAGASDVINAGAKGINSLNQRAEERQIQDEIETYANSPINHELFSKNLPDGNIEVHRDSNIMAHNGVLRATTGMNGKGDSILTYDNAQLQTVNRNGYNHLVNAEKLYSLGNEGQKSLNDMGISKIGRNSEGNFVVAYNQIGKDRLGFNKIDTYKDGRMVENKSRFHPINSSYTIAVKNVSTQNAPQQEQQHHKHEFSNNA